ncbi:MAG: hypothetical protein C0404_04375 [Verrucomicrobia bacterium]|nr:hypothetical protein [Verrucomicrobiota bacterium]
MKTIGQDFTEMCEVLGKSNVYIRNIQTKLGLHIPPHKDGYSTAYANFLKTIVRLRTFGVPLEDIGELLEAEKKLLQAMRVDTITDSKTWYLDACGHGSANGNRLLLTNYDVGQSVTVGSFQYHLDFAQRSRELFSAAEMGEDARRILHMYTKQRDRILDRVRDEEPVLEDALSWSARMLYGED